MLIRQRLNSLNLDNKGTKEVLLERLIAAIKKGKAIVFDFEKLIHEETKCKWIVLYYISLLITSVNIAQSHGPAYPAGTSKTFKWIVENKGFQEGDYQVVFNHAIQHDCAAHAQVAARIFSRSPSALCPLPSALCPLPSPLSPLPSPLSPLPSPLSPLPLVLWYETSFDVSRGILGTPEYRSSSLRHVCSVGSKVNL